MFAKTDEPVVVSPDVASKTASTNEGAARLTRYGKVPARARITHENVTRMMLSLWDISILIFFAEMIYKRAPVVKAIRLDK
jgi:hypothetical protein